MKKSTKPAASPAPATPAKKAAAAAPSVAAPAPAKKTPPRFSPGVAKIDPVNKPAVAAPVHAAPATAAAAAKAEKPNVTSITAKIDVGFGNTLFVRGEGPGLSWNKGLPLKNAGSDEWSISFPKATRPISFKLLINDDTWSQGPDYVADPGDVLTVYPAF